MKKLACFALCLFSMTSNAQEYEIYADNEWVPVSLSADRKTTVLARKDKITYRTAGWFKFNKQNGHTMDLYYVNCSTSQMLTGTSVHYDKNGNMKNEYRGNRWEIVIPDSQGEIVYDIICNGKEKVDEYGNEFIEEVKEQWRRRSGKR